MQDVIYEQRTFVKNGQTITGQYPRSGELRGERGGSAPLLAEPWPPKPVFFATGILHQGGQEIARFPVVMEQATTIDEAFAQLPACLEAAKVRALAEIQQMQEAEARQIVVPGQMPPGQNRMRLNGGG